MSQDSPQPEQTEPKKRGKAALDKHGLPPRDVNGRANPDYYRAFYGKINQIMLDSVSSGDRIPFNYEGALAGIDKEAKAAGFDPKTLKDQRTPEQRIADAIERLAENPREIWEQIDDEADRVIEMMDKADRGAFAYIGEKAKASGIPKLVRGVLMKIRTLRSRARLATSPQMLKTAMDTLYPAKGHPTDWQARAALEAAWPLRLMVYCGRSNLPHLANAAPDESVYDVAKHHCKIACDVWHARKAIRYGIPKDQSSLLSRANWGECEYNGCIVVCAPGHGKPLHVDTPVLMSDGTYRRLGDVRVGDSVISHSGVPRRVTEVHEQGMLECVTIKTNSDRTVVSAATHPFLTASGWKNASDITDKDTLAIPFQIATHPSSNTSPTEARLIGYMVGDGNCTNATQKNTVNARFTNGEQVIVESFIKCATDMGFRTVVTKARSNATDVRLTNNSSRPQDWLRSIGLAGKSSYTKRVPSAIFSSSNDSVRHYIAAHFETDGSVTKKGNAREDCCISLYSVSRDLLTDVQRLLLRFGIHSRVRIKNGLYKGRKHESWSLSISDRHNAAIFMEQIPVIGPKSDRMRQWDVRRTRFDGQYISDRVVSVDKCGKQECRCLTVDVDHTFLANDLVVHNTEIGRFIVGSMIAENPYHQVMLNHAVGEKSFENLAYLASLFKRDTEVGRRFGSLFPNLTLAQSSTKKFRLKLANDTKSPTANASGVGSKVSGSNASIQWWDDPVDQAEAVQETERKQTFETLNGTWLPRLRKGGFLLVTATLWHKADAISRFIENAKASAYKKSIQRCGGPKTSPEFAPIWPDMYPASRLRQIYATMRNPGLYSAAYMANPVAEEKRIVRKLRLYDPNTDEHRSFFENSAKYLSLDPAATRGERSDHAGALYAGFGTVRIDKSVDGRIVSATEHRIRVISADAIPATQAELVAHTVELSKTRPIDYVMVECRSGYVGTAEMFENYHGVDVIRIDPRSRGKEERLRAAAPAMEDANADLGVRAVVELPGVQREDGTMILDPRFTQLAEEILDFGVCATDDMVDALTQMVIYLSPDLGIGTGGIINRQIAKSQGRAGIDPKLDEYLKQYETPRTENAIEHEDQQWMSGNWSLPKSNGPNTGAGWL